MSGSAVKEKNRDIRRAFGADAVNHIASLGLRQDELSAGLTHHTEVLKAHTESLCAQRAVIDATLTAVEKLRDEVRAQRARQAASTWARLRWMATGK